MATPKKSKKSKAKREELGGQADPRAALDSAALLAAAKPLLVRLEADLIERAKGSPAVTTALTARYEAEKAANRTADSFAGWTAALATQVAAAWVLSCVFVRTLEDRGLLKQARLAGPGAEDSQRQFFQLAPSLTERDYLLTVFRELAHHPAAKDLFDPEHSLVWKLSPSAEAAKELLALFRAPTANEPAFRFGQASTRFLGDLYQDLSEEVRKRYALLQTPEFVEEYILDKTLEPAIARFGLDDTTLIDPTCGSGHFLLGAFDRLFEHRLRAEPGIDPRVAAAKALDAVYGADINPYAVAIARFRLTLSFLDKAGYAKLADAPALPLHLVVADSLRINPQHPQQELWQAAGADSAAWLGDVFAVDDERAAKDVLSRQYAAVVGNPPYITVKDRALRELYRRMYPRSCFREYALAAPFCERFFQLARVRGYAGQITANSFMKREFGKALIQEFLPTVNLQSIVNTSGAYIPGHATPTVLLFGSNEPPQNSELDAVLAKRGEPSTPADAGQGLVWRSIVDHGDELGFEDAFITVARVRRDVLSNHPWSLGGGGAAELKQLLEERAPSRLGDLVSSIGFMCITKQDDVFSHPVRVLSRAGVEAAVVGVFVIGEHVRDWSIASDIEVVFPYTEQGELKSLPPKAARFLWPFRAVLEARSVFGGQTFKQAKRTWYEYGQIPADRVAGSAITFAFVATHNHFVLDRGGKVFNRSAPIIKLPEGATEDDHLALLAYLNSSTACFWMKQVFHDKGSTAVDRASQAEKAKVAYEFTGTGLEALPVPDLANVRGHLSACSRALLLLGAKREEAVQAAVAHLLRGEQVDAARAEDARLLETMITIQEEIDWLIYEHCGLADSTRPDNLDLVSVPRTPLGTRPFEIELTSRGVTKSIDGHPLHSDAGAIDNSSYQEIIRRRASNIRENTELRILEDAHYKRRWAIWTKSARVVRFDDRVRDALARSIDDRIEEEARRRTECWTWNSVAESARIHPDALTWLLGRPATALDLKQIINAQSVPFARALRFRESGIQRSLEWEALWEAQRAEDRGLDVLPSIPGKYDDKDYATDTIANLRGKLDAPNERFISYPFCECDQDGEPVYGWAGWDHLQRAQALASLYLKRKDSDGWTKERLTPMLAGLLELIPWVKQWHNEPSADFGGLRMGDYFEQFLDGECRQHGLTHGDLRAWRPPKKGRGAANKAKRAEDAEASTDADAAPPKTKKSRAKKTRVSLDSSDASTEAE